VKTRTKIEGRTRREKFLKRGSQRTGRGIKNWKPEKISSIAGPEAIRSKGGGAFVWNKVLCSCTLDEEILGENSNVSLSMYVRIIQIRENCVFMGP